MNQKCYDAVVMSLSRLKIHLYV